MAEQEVVKHTKKVFKIWSSKEHSFWYKLREFFIEIAIIVFAVSLSIWLHDKSEHRHQQKEVKEFLLGLREDLLSDIFEMENDRQSYVDQGKTFRYITRMNPGESINADSLNKYRNWLFNTTRLEQNNGRFEGFKSSGKIGTIEDKLLQNDIMDLYQENIPSLLSATDPYLYRKNQFFDYTIKNGRRVIDSTTNLAPILVTPEAQSICSYLSRTDEIIGRYDASMNKMKAIVKRIEEEYDISTK